MNALITAFFYKRPAVSEYAWAEMAEMLTLWLTHLRGPGGYTGDIALLGNLASLDELPTDAAELADAEGVTLLPFDDVAESHQATLLNTILAHDVVPAEAYDVVMQLDLDVLAQRDVTPLFARGEKLRAAASGAAVFARAHARSIMTKAEAASAVLRRPRLAKRRGISSCAFSCLGSTWHGQMSAWAELIRERRDRFPLPSLSDQSYLNLAWLLGVLDAESMPAEHVVHGNWSAAADPILLHFPVPGRLAKMRDHATIISAVATV
ncbi:MAG: hypothetical protein AAF656_02310 [Planctomycetota bacterium]